MSEPHLVRVADVAGLEHGQSRIFTFEREGEQKQGFVMRNGETLVAYMNWCPHWGVDLDYGEGRFYAAKVDRIVCRNHGALFELDTGTCVAGPCMGQGLVSFAVEAQGDDLIVDTRLRFDPV